MTLKTLKLLFLLVSVLCVNLSCKKESEPEPQAEVLPKLKTFPITVTGNAGPNSNAWTYHYKLVVEEKGNVPVMKYGVTWHSYRSSEMGQDYVIRFPIVQDINYTAHPFNIPFEKGERKYDFPNFPFLLKGLTYQRAYAVLQDGRVVYGDVIESSPSGNKVIME